MLLSCRQKLGDALGLLEDKKTCIDRLAALQQNGCRVALTGPGEDTGKYRYKLDPVYDWYVNEIDAYAKA